ncbi:acyltransferase, partial [Mycobacterium tuberculosis]
PQPRNSSERLQIVANATLDADYYAGFKLDQIGEQLVYKTGSGPKRVLFVGDSHVQQYAPRVMELSRTLAMPDKSAWFVT